MLLWVSVASAGLIDTLSDEERQVAICQAAAAPATEAHDYAKAAVIWDACAAEAKRAGLTSAVPMLEDQVALTRARAKAAAWRTSDPNRYALDVLSVAADQRSSYYPGEDVPDIFRAWMTTEAGKGRLAPVRTVTLQWAEPPDSAELGVRAAELFRREVEDLGLKWADPGHPEVDVIVFATLDLIALDPVSTTAAGSLPRAEARFDAERVRFRTIDRSTGGFRVSASAEEAERAAAEDLALRASAERAAARLLKQVLQAVFD
jgi:hypothetical protein